MRKTKLLSFLFCVFTCFTSFGQGVFDPCGPTGEIRPACAGDNNYNVAYNSVTGQSSGTDNGWYTSQNLNTCLSSSPNASWYALQIAAPGDLLLYIYQYSGVLPNGQPDPSSTPRDVDFACWGPFSTFEVYNIAELHSKLCNGTFTLSSGGSTHRPSNGNHSNNNTGGYPIDNNPNDPDVIPIVDCSYAADGTEWCFIPNAQQGDWYLILICNYNGGNGHFGFQPQTTGINPNNQGTTNCQALNCIETTNAMPCEGSSFSLYCTEARSTLPSNVQYKWIAPNGTVLGITTNPDSVFTLTANINMSGQFELVLMNLRDNAGNPIPDRHGFIDIAVQQTPAVITASETVICKGDSIILRTPYRDVYTSDYEGYTRWFYQNQDGSPIGTDTSLVVYPTEDCNYILKVKDGLSECNNADTISITVNPIPEITLVAGDTNLCPGEQTQITATCEQNVSYRWSNGATTATITAEPSETRTYTVNVKLRDGAQCEKDSSIVIHVDENIQLRYETEPSHCGQRTGEITMHATGGDGTFTFSSNPNTATFIDSIASNLLSGSYTVTATDGMACTQSITVEVPSIPGPTPCFLFTSNDNVNMIITNCTQGANNNYFWDFGDGANSTETHPVHEYMEPGLYSVSLTVANDFNCVDSLRQDYKINGPVYIPNAFSPNGDGVNDELFVIGKTIQKEEFFWAVYDRHGTLVFLSLDPTIGWDGTIHAGKNKLKDASPGVYVYRLKYKDVNGNYFERDGSITLIR